MSSNNVKQDTLTNRDLSIIYDKISDLFVKEMCESLVNRQDMTTILSQNLQQKMSEILSKPDTQSKMNDILMQSVNVSLRKATNGPILLYALLTQNIDIHDKTKAKILEIFKKVYQDGDDIYKYRKRLITELQTPPYRDWFPSTTQSGGKRKRKTRRKSTRQKRNKKNKTRRGGNITDSVKGVGKKMSKTWQGASENISGAAGYAKDSALGAATSISDSASGMKNRLLGRTPATESQIEGTTNELYEKYNKTLVDMATQKLDKTSSDIAKKMTNVSYVYMMKNGKQVLDSTLHSIEKTIQNNQSIQNVLPILVVQSLYQARNVVVRALMSANKEHNSDNFEKPDDTFVTIFIEKLIEKLKKEVGDVDPE